MSWDYRAPAMLPGGHLQTIWAAKCAAYWPHSDGVPPTWERQRWTTPDNDFIDVDHLGKTLDATHKPLLVLFHGLEGGRSSHYVQAIAKRCELKGWRMLLAHFRGCSGEINAAPRAYHSGDHEEIDWILRRASAIAPQSQTVALGISLGGNALMCWASKAESTASKIVSAVASVCSPLDLVSSGLHIGKGFNKLVYTRMFLGTMKPKAAAKWAQFPGLFNLEAALEARTLYEFDDNFTAPIHGFKSVMDYWTKASAKPQINTIRIPALVLNALNDPFIPTDSLPKRKDVSSCVTLWQPNTGGHVGFVGLQPWWALPGHVSTMPSAVIGWLSAQLSS